MTSILPRAGEIGSNQDAKRIRSANTLGFLIAFAALALISSPAANAVVVTDSFSDFNDTANPSWIRMDGTINSTGRTWDASTGQYYLHTNNDSTDAPGFGFVGSYVETPFTDVRVAADFVDVTAAELESPTPAYFGVVARMHGATDLNSDGDTLDLNEVNAPPVANALSLYGYMYAYEPFASFGNPNGLPGRGEMVLYVFDGGADTDVRSQKVHLDETKDYRFVLEVIGPTLHGQVFNLTDGGVMVAEAFRDLVVETQNTDHDNNSVTPQIPHVPYTNGFSGVMGVGSSIASGEMQFAVDNFRTETAVAGDYNRNGVVDGADYVLWRKTIGSTGPNGNPPTSFGDLRANGAFSVGQTQTIDTADFNFWRTNFGTTASGSGLASGGNIPEPASAFFAIVGFVLSWCGRRRV